MYILNNMFNSIYDEELGYRPSSLSIKPAHIANGLVKNTLGKYYKITEIAKFLEQKIKEHKNKFDS